MFLTGHPLFFKGKVYRAEYEEEAYQVLPMEGLFEVQNGKKAKYHQRYYLLRNL